ncbi:MAG: hypothetical protein ABII22_01955 [Candidatus Micrarchaeota archaeon]
MASASPMHLYTREGDMRRELIGAGSFATCAILSTSLLTDLAPQVGLDAMGALVKHEIGHLLMEKEGHCTDDKCVMQANNQSLERFLELSSRKLKFCRSCQVAICHSISLLEDGCLGKINSDICSHLVD